MRIKRLLSTTAVALIVLVVAAVGALFIAYDRNLYVPEGGPAPELLIRGGTLFDATGTEPIDNPGLLVRDGTIACLGAACASSASDAAVEIDASGLAILPGLIDLHVHFFAITRDNADMNMPRLVWNIARSRPDVRRKLLESGVTSVRDAGGPRDVMIDVKGQIAEGALAGPRLFVPGPLFTAPGGHPAYGGQDPNTFGYGGDMAFQSNDPRAVREEVALLANQGVDGIKAVLHGATSPEGEVALPTLSTQTLRALVDAAQAEDLWVAVHVGPLDETKTAAAAGATTIEHGVRAGNRVDDETIRALIENDVVYVPTLGREPQGHLNIPALHDGGVTIGVGTDTNNPEMAYGDSYHEELARMVDAGMPPAAVLLAATRNGAKALKLGDSLGTIEEGKVADLIVVSGEPWNDVADLRSIATVIQDGRIIVDRRAR